MSTRGQERKIEMKPERWISKPIWWPSIWPRPGEGTFAYLDKTPLDPGWRSGRDHQLAEGSGWRPLVRLDRDNACHRCVYWGLDATDDFVPRSHHLGLVGPKEKLPKGFVCQSRLGWLTPPSPGWGQFAVGWLSTEKMVALELFIWWTDHFLTAYYFQKI
jgi:hypothetical protein